MQQTYKKTLYKQVMQLKNIYYANQRPREKKQLQRLLISLFKR